MNKIAAISGAASGIGQAASRRLLEAGWTVFGLDLARGGLDAAAREFAAFQGRFKPVACDVSDAEQVAAAFAGIGLAATSLNALVCCAGVLRTGLMEHMTVADFDLVLNTNTRGTFLCAQKALPLLRKAATPESPSRVVGWSLHPRDRCGIESGGQPIVPGDGRRVGAIRRAGQRVGAGDGGYADGACHGRSVAIEGLPPVRRFSGGAHRPAG